MSCVWFIRRGHIPSTKRRRLPGLTRIYAGFHGNAPQGRKAVDGTLKVGRSSPLGLGSTKNDQTHNFPDRVIGRDYLD